MALQLTHWRRTTFLPSALNFTLLPLLIGPSLSQGIAWVGLQLVDAVLAEVPTNLQTLHLLQMLLRRLNRAAESSKAVLAASASKPKDIELMRAVFEVHVKYAAQCLLPCMQVPNLPAPCTFPVFLRAHSTGKSLPRASLVS